jgi:hypothetical protein
MKSKVYRFLVILITAVFLSSTIQAQHCAQASGSGACNPTPGLTQLGFYPPDTALPCMIIGQPFDTVINFHTPPTAQGYTLNWIKILHIDNAPCGLCWRSNDPNDKVNGNATGCVRVSGITYDAPGEYNIIVYADVNVTVGIFPLTINNLNIDSVMGLKYYLRVKQTAGSSCPPVDTLSPGLFAHAAGTAPAPSITAANSSICSGATQTLGISGGSYYAYQWSTGALTSTITAGPGTYTVTVYANCASATATRTISTTSVSATATPNGPTTFCQGGSVTLNAGAGFSAYSWSGGGGSGQTATYSTAGTYTCTVTQNGCTGTTNTVTVTVNNNPSPTVTAGGSTSICSGGSVTLDAGAGYSAYAWSDGSTTTQTLSATTAGTYTCTVTQNGCTGTSNTITVTVGNPTPTIQASGPVSFCSGGNVTLDAGAGFSAYAWSNNATSQTINVTTGGTYTCTVTAGGCQGTSNTVTVTVSGSTLTPAITASNGLSICTGGATTLDAGSGYTSYAWSNTGSNQTTAITTSGTYTVTVSQGACTGTANATVNVGSFPVTVTLTPANPPAGCQGDIINIDAGAGHASYAWSTNATTQAVDASATGTLTVTVTDANACTGTASVGVTINALPTPTPTPAGAQSICAGGSLTLDAGAGYSSYAWSNGDNTQTSTVSTAGSYMVTVTQNGCQGSSANPIVVTVNQAPVPNITPGGTHNICTGHSVILDAGSGYSAYLWSNGATSQTITVDSTGTYNVTVTQNGCTGYSGNPPTVFAQITPTATITEVSNANGQMLLQAGPANASYQWLYQTQAGGPMSIELTTGPLDTVSCGDVAEYHTVVVTQNGCADTSSTFTVLCLGINNISSLMSFSVMPNPATDVLNVAYELNDPTLTQISITDLAGRKVMEVVSENLSRGPHQHHINLSHLTGGIYMLNFTTDRGSFNTKFVKQ